MNYQEYKQRKQKHEIRLAELREQREQAIAVGMTQQEMDIQIQQEAVVADLARLRRQWSNWQSR